MLVFHFLLASNIGPAAAQSRALPRNIAAPSESAEIAIPQPQCFLPVYTSDFESEVNSDWSTQLTAVTPADARRFLGLFGNELVQLSLTNLPRHSQVSITFDLYLKDSWDGNEGPIIGGPDRWSLAVQDGPTLLDTTFSLLPDFCDCQAYPDNYLDGNHRGRTGAAENDTLGYIFDGRPMDAVYHLNFNFPHTAASLVFDFLANRSSLTIADESWGIDNVLVEVEMTSAPEIVKGPEGTAVTVGSEVRFAVEAKYASEYQWFFQETLVAGATNAILRLTNVQTAQGGDYYVRVNNCAGSTNSPVAKLTLRQPNQPPTVELIKPSDRASYCPNSTVEMEVEVSGPGNVQRVVFYAGTSFLGSDESAPFTFAWDNVETGDFSLTARAIDVQGRITLSESIRITVSQLCGDVAIVRPREDPEIDAMQGYLFEMGLASRVFDAATVTQDQLLLYRLVIYHGQDQTEISERLISIFHQLRQSNIEPHPDGMPLYFIGQRLIESGQNLTGEPKAVWTNLLRLQAGGGRANNEFVRIEGIPRLEDPILRGSFGDVESFRYTNQVESALADVEPAPLNAELYGMGQPSGAAVLLKYPHTDNTDTTLPQSFTQTCTVTTGGDDASLFERKKLFENVVCFLIRECQCHTLSLALDISGPSGTVQAGTTFEISISVQQAGECEAAAVTATIDLADGLACIDGQFEQGTFECDSRQPVFNIGHMRSASRAEMKLMVKALRPGAYENCATVRANNAASEPGHTVCMDTTVEGGPAPGLRLDQPARGRLRLSLTGRDGQTYQLQRTDSLAKPISWSNWIEATTTKGTWESELFDALGGAYFRAVAR